MFVTVSGRVMPKCITGMMTKRFDITAVADDAYKADLKDSLRESHRLTCPDLLKILVSNHFLYIQRLRATAACSTVT